jgi:hypothetical protein
MRTLFALIAIVYFVGVGVALAPTIQGQSNAGSASEFAASIGHALPDALAWPTRL